MQTLKAKIYTLLSVNLESEQWGQELCKCSFFCLSCHWFLSTQIEFYLFHKKHFSVLFTKHKCKSVNATDLLMWVKTSRFISHNVFLTRCTFEPLVSHTGGAGKSPASVVLDIYLKEEKEFYLFTFAKYMLIMKDCLKKSRQLP